MLIKVGEGGGQSKVVEKRTDIKTQHDKQQTRKLVLFEGGGEYLNAERLEMSSMQ